MWPTGSWLGCVLAGKAETYLLIASLSLWLSPSSCPSLFPVSLSLSLASVSECDSRRQPVQQETFALAARPSGSMHWRRSAAVCPPLLPLPSPYPRPWPCSCPAARVGKDALNLWHWTFIGRISVHFHACIKSNGCICRKCFIWKGCSDCPVESFPCLSSSPVQILYVYINTALDPKVFWGQVKAFCI